MIFQLFLMFYLSDYVTTADPAILYLSTSDGTKIKTPISDEIASEINYNIPLILIIHGWLQNSDHGHYLELTKAYNNLGKNVINVDWGKLASAPYIEAVIHTRIVANHTGTFIVSLLKYGLDLSKLHIVGHSLGAHVAGFMGKYIKNFSAMKVARITGLDPAGWGFYKLNLCDNEENRLSKDDANLVVILNTSILFGIWRSLGQVTFYANHGIYQPGCPFDDDPNTADIFCSHQRSLSYMIESLHSNKFVGRSPSENQTLVFNEEIPCEAKGIYYFTTNIKKPYGQG